MTRTLLTFGLLIGATALGAWFALAAKSDDDQNVIITLAAEPRQALAGFGTSLMNGQSRFQQLPPAVREEMSAAVWRDLDFKILRLWWSPSTYENQNIAPFRRQFVDSGMIDLARKHGCTTLLLGPDDVPESFAKPKPAGAMYAEFSDEGVTQYARRLAMFIRQVRDELKVTIHATGILNEPNDREIRFTLAQWPLMIRSLRKELDERGLKDVAIVAPELANCDDVAYAVIDALKADPQAWAALQGVSTHSYAMATTDTMVNRLAGSGKPYWQTESSTPGPVTDDVLNAAMTGARAISDLNHGVTHWLWFIGYEQTDPPDNGTRLIRYDATKPDGEVHKLAPYFTMQQLSQAFSPGAVFYPCRSSSEGTMTWTYGRKPAITTAVAKNTDGTLAIAVQNFTSERFSDLPAEAREQAGPDARTITVNIRLPQALAGATFTVHRTGEKDRNTAAAPITADGGTGTISVTVAPLELVTLRTAR